MAYLQYGKNILRRGSNERLHHPLFYAAQGVRYRKLEVILTTTIDKLGKAGETVKVAPGYFRNHLMPKLLAVPNIDKFAHLIRDQRKVALSLFWLAVFRVHQLIVRAVWLELELFLCFDAG